jgi:diguanylate cyclase (GGDEF)-like protein/PAS domain S-box-containing protein
MDAFASIPDDPQEVALALIHSRSEASRLKEREQLFSALLASVNAVLWAYDWQAHKMVYVSPAYETIFGRSAALLLADYGEWRNSIYPDDLEETDQHFFELLTRGSIQTREYRIIRGDGEIRWLCDKCFISEHGEAGLPMMVVGITEDITASKELASEMQRLATTDVLTGSSNRRHFFEFAEQAFRQAREGDREGDQALAFLLIDVDDFKKINDKYGHQIGDQVLQQIAKAAGRALRSGDMFGRIGGEEFAVLLPGCEPDLARQIAERLRREVLRLSFGSEQGPFGITISQGLASLRPEDESIDNLYARADAGLYQAKRQGKDQVVLG